MNMMKLALVIAAAGVAGCASSPAELAASTPQAAAVAADADPTEVTLEEITLDPGSAVVCRDELKQGSNVLTTMCMSRNDWERYERFRAREAAAIVRTLQGGAYR